MCLCQCVYGGVCVWKEGGLSIIPCKGEALLYFTRKRPLCVVEVPLTYQT